jgi:hypothetical protein
MPDVMQISRSLAQLDPAGVLLLLRRFLPILLLLTLPGCGGSREGVVSTANVVDAVRQAGFTDVHVWSTAPSAETRKRFPKAHWLISYVVETGTNRLIMVAPIAATRLPSVADAKRRAGAPAPTQTQADAIVPGYKLDAHHEYRVCNVVVDSYNPTGDSTLSARVSRVRDLLKAACG